KRAPQAAPSCGVATSQVTSSRGRPPTPPSSEFTSSSATSTAASPSGKKASLWAKPIRYGSPSASPPGPPEYSSIHSIASASPIVRLVPSSADGSEASGAASSSEHAASSRDPTARNAAAP